VKYELHHGPATEILYQLPERFIRTCVTSPPYYGLRTYTDSDKEIGREDSVGAYVQSIRNTLRSVRRVLTDDGTIWLVMGDVYKNKCLQGVPWRVAFALIDDGWVLRNDVIWHKPNCVPESVTDRLTRSHEYIFFFAKSRRYFFDQDAIREPLAESSIGRRERYLRAIAKYGTPERDDSKHLADGVDQSHAYAGMALGRSPNAYNLKGRNKRTVWEVGLTHYKGNHFATFPEKLVESCILAASQENDTVLDPFSGTATTGVVALRLRRNYIGIDINEEYLKQSEHRLKRQLGEGYDQDGTEELVRQERVFADRQREEIPASLQDGGVR